MSVLPAHGACYCRGMRAEWRQSAGMRTLWEQSAGVEDLRGDGAER